MKGQVEDRPPDGEAALVERAKRGDQDAYGELVRRHQGIAFRTAYVITGSAAEAEDAVQVGFTNAWRALGRFRSGAPFRPWALQIIANEARNRRRSQGRRGELELRAARESVSGDAVPSPETAILAAEQRAGLLAAINMLKEDDRLVLSCRYFLELSEDETAAALGVARGTVKSRTSRALARLRQVIHD